MLIVMIFIANFGKFYTALSMTKRYIITYKKQNMIVLNNLKELCEAIASGRNIFVTKLFWQLF
jgi:hypothetical protein